MVEELIIHIPDSITNFLVILTAILTAIWTAYQEYRHRRTVQPKLPHIHVEIDKANIEAGEGTSGNVGVKSK